MDSLFHVLEAQQFSRDVMNEIFDVTARDGSMWSAAMVRIF